MNSIAEHWFGLLDLQLHCEPSNSVVERHVLTIRLWLSKVHFDGQKTTLTSEYSMSLFRFISNVWLLTVSFDCYKASVTLTNQKLTVDHPMQHLRGKRWWSIGKRGHCNTQWSLGNQYSWLKGNIHCWKFSFTVDRAAGLLKCHVEFWKSTLAIEIPLCWFANRFDCWPGRAFQHSGCLTLTLGSIGVPFDYTLVHIHPLFISGWLGYLDTLFSQRYGYALTFASLTWNMWWDRAVLM